MANTEADSNNRDDSSRSHALTGSSRVAEYVNLLEKMVADIDPLEYPEESLEAAAIRMNHRKYYSDNY